MMASRAVNIAAAGGRRASYSLGRLNIQTIMCYPFSSRVPTSRHPHEAGDDDVSRIRKSLDNDDGKDYAEDEEEEDRGDVTGFTRKTVETVFNAGGSVAEGMEQTFGALKETSEKVKEAVLGDHNDRSPKDYMQDKSADDRLGRNNDSGDTKWKA